MSDVLNVSGTGPVRVITINRPEYLNAVNRELHHELALVWAELAEDRTARAVILTGAGRAFCSGGDFGWLAQVAVDPHERRRCMREARRIALEMAHFPLPVVAAVNGPAVGLGCSIAVLCDHVLMSEDAFLSDPHVAVGLAAGDGGAAAWPLYASLLQVKEYVLTGRRIAPVDAVRIGLANEVVPASGLMKRAEEIALAWSALPYQALQDTKRALNMHLERAMSGVLEFALAAESENFLSTEHAERVAAFAVKERKPDNRRS